MRGTPFTVGRTSGSMYAIEVHSATLVDARNAADNLLMYKQRLYGEYCSDYAASQYRRGFTAGFNAQRKKQASYSKKGV